MKRVFPIGLVCLLAFSFSSCDPFYGAVDDHPVDNAELRDLARMFSELPLGKEHLEEVHSAVTESMENGYDEEYMLRDILTEPGRGVGSERLASKPVRNASVMDEDVAVSTRAGSPGKSFSRPLRSLIKDYYSARTKSGSVSADDMLKTLECSDAQIYWPYSERWDGEQYPVITFSPVYDAETNIGYELLREEDGRLQARQVTVDENMARNRPVWVLNRNDDNEYESLELRRRLDPDWGQGGEVYVKSGEGQAAIGAVHTKSGEEENSFKTLYLKDIMLKRNFDSWFGGASEIVVHCGGVNGFNASTEAELKLYTPTVTNFMISVPRSKVGEKIPFNAVLISDFTSLMDKLAFLLIEDDGGTQTSWKTEAAVKIQSKSYGFTIAIPLNIHDDIIWRGQLSADYIMDKSGKTECFGDVELTFLLE